MAYVDFERLLAVVQNTNGSYTLLFKGGDYVAHVSETAAKDVLKYIAPLDGH